MVGSAVIGAGVEVAVLSNGLCVGIGPGVEVGSNPQPNTTTIARVSDKAIPAILSEKVVGISQTYNGENDQGAGVDTCPLTRLIRHLY